jgi:hypothetical protein
MVSVFSCAAQLRVMKVLKKYKYVEVNNGSLQQIRKSTD